MRTTARAETVVCLRGGMAARKQKSRGEEGRNQVLCLVKGRANIGPTADWHVLGNQHRKPNHLFFAFFCLQGLITAKLQTLQALFLLAHPISPVVPFAAASNLFRLVSGFGRVDDNYSRQFRQPTSHHQSSFGNAPTSASSSPTSTTLLEHDCKLSAVCETVHHSPYCTVLYCQIKVDTT